MNRLNQMIIEIDNSIDLDNMPERLKQAIEVGAIQWPENQMTNTKVIDGKKLILIMSLVKPAKLKKWFSLGYPHKTKENKNTPEDERELVELETTWNILAEEDKKIKPAAIKPYINDDLIYNEDGDVIASNPVTNLKGRLQTWAGRNWKY